MKFKPGDKVWLHVIMDWTLAPPEWHPTPLACGKYAAVILGQCDPGYWELDVVGYSCPPDAEGIFAHESILEPRDDLSPQQEPKHEEVGSWDNCVWRPRETLPQFEPAGFSFSIG